MHFSFVTFSLNYYDFYTNFPENPSVTSSHCFLQGYDIAVFGTLSLYYNRIYLIFILFWKYIAWSCESNFKAVIVQGFAHFQGWTLVLGKIRGNFYSALWLFFSCVILIFFFCTFYRQDGAFNILVLYVTHDNLFIKRSFHKDNNYSTVWCTKQKCTIYASWFNEFV